MSYLFSDIYWMARDRGSWIFQRAWMIKPLFWGGNKVNVKLVTNQASLAYAQDTEEKKSKSSQLVREKGIRL